MSETKGETLEWWVCKGCLEVESEDTKDPLIAALSRVAEAIEAGTIQPIIVPEGACVVFRTPQLLSLPVYDAVCRTMHANFPNRRFVIIENGAELSVLAETKVEVAP